MVLLFDDIKRFRDIFKESLPKMDINLEVIECSTKEELRKKLKDADLMKNAKVLIFDLSTSKEEEETLNFDILDDIRANYNAYPIPIFIHSAFADKVDGYDNLGTLFKIKKGSNSVQEILDKIKIFYDSGFLEIFSPGGSIEKELFIELHKAFINQFKGDEIKEILESIKSSNGDFKIRTKSVFERIAVRSLFQNMVSAKKQDDSENIEEIKINAVEHYYRRESDFPIWTGDIFRNIATQKDIVIITPRCDINNGYCNNNFLVCTIDRLELKKVKDMGKDPAKLGDYINDNPQNTGIKYRYLISTPAYEGGKIDLTNYFIINKAIIDAEYKYVISLSDELTNDVIRKYASYILRGGISASELTEAAYYSTVQSSKIPNG